MAVTILVLYLVTWSQLVLITTVSHSTISSPGCGPWAGRVTQTSHPGVLGSSLAQGARRPLVTVSTAVGRAHIQDTGPRLPTLGSRHKGHPASGSSSQVGTWPKKAWR